jgi:hypothetical protein
VRVAAEEVDSCLKDCYCRSWVLFRQLPHVVSAFDEKEFYVGARGFQGGCEGGGLGRRYEPVLGPVRE